MKYRKLARPLAFTVASLLAFQPMTALAVTFADINQVPWPGAEVSINKAADLGLVVGEIKNGKNYFRPRDTVSLSESCQFAYKVLLQTGKVKADSSVTEKWKTVMATYKIQDWAFPAISFCLENDIISISDLSNFVKNGSNMPASREQAAEILGRALTVGVPSYTAKASNTAFNDNANIATDARPYIALLNEKGIVNGDENKNFNPKKTLNRTETAVMVTNLYEKLKSAPATPAAPTSSTVSGTVKDLTTFYVNFEGSAAYYLYASTGATVTLNGSSSTIDKLVTLFKEGAEMKATLTLDGNTRITKIAVTAEDEEAETSEKKDTEGTLTDVKYDDDDDSGKIELNDKSTYKIDDSKVNIEIDDEDYDISDLYDLFEECEDDDKIIKVELTLDKDGKVKKIVGEVKNSDGKSEGDAEGTITDVEYDEEDEEGRIELDDDDKYDFDADTDIEIDGKSADWEDLLDTFEEAEDDDEELEAVLTLDKKDNVTEIEVYTESYNKKNSSSKNNKDEAEGEIEDMSYDYDDEEGEIEVDGDTYEINDDTEIEIKNGDDEIDNCEDLYAAFEFGMKIEVTVETDGDEATEITGNVVEVEGVLNGFGDDYLKLEFEAELDDDDVTKSYKYYFTENDRDDEDEEEDWEDDADGIDVDGLTNVKTLLDFYEVWLDDKDTNLKKDVFTLTLTLDDDGFITAIEGDMD